jgi:hypothetical protein
MFDALLVSRPTRGGVQLYTAALLTLGAAGIHFAVTPEHLDEYAPFGVFLLVVGSIQALVAAIDLSSRLRQGAATRAFGRLSLTVGVLSLIELTLSLAVSPLGGLVERTLLVTDAAWVVLVAIAMSRIRGPCKC